MGRPVHELSHHVQPLGVDEDTGPLQGERNGRAVVGDDRKVENHALDERQAEAFVFAHGQEDVGRPVQGEHLFVRDVPGKDDLLGPEEELIGHPDEAPVIPGEGSGLSDDDEPDEGRDVPLEVERRPDEVLDPLVRGDAADEEDVGPVVTVEAVDEGAHGPGVLVKIDEKGKDARLPVAQVRELPAVVLRIRQGDVDDRRQKGQLFASQPADPGHLRVERSKEVLRRDVVVDKDLPALEPGESLSQGGGQGKMEERHIARSGRLEFRERLSLKTPIAVQAVDPGSEPLRPEEIPHMGRGVPDGVSAVIGRDELVDPHCADTLFTWSRRILETFPAAYFSRARSWPSTTCPRNERSLSRRSIKAAVAGRFFSLRRRPPPFMVSSTAPAANPMTGTRMWNASMMGTPNPSCSLMLR